MFNVKKPRLALFLFISSFWFNFQFSSPSWVFNFPVQHLNQLFRSRLFPEYSLDFSRTFPVRIFHHIPWNIWQHSPERSTTFPGMFEKNPQNFSWHSRKVWRHFPKCLTTFPGIFYNVPWNVWQHSPECSTTFPGMFENIRRNFLEKLPGIF